MAAVSRGSRWMDVVVKTDKKDIHTVNVHLPAEHGHGRAAELQELRQHMEAAKSGAIWIVGGDMNEACGTLAGVAADDEPPE